MRDICLSDTHETTHDREKNKVYADINEMSNTNGAKTMPPGFVLTQTLRNQDAEKHFLSLQTICHNQRIRRRNGSESRCGR